MTERGQRQESEAVTVRFEGPLAARTEVRRDRDMGHTLGDVVERDLGRYYELVRRARAEADGRLSAAEQGLIVDCCNGVLHDEVTLTLLPHDVEDAIAFGGLGAKWGVDGEALVRKLSDMPPVMLAAIVDACERYWSGGMRDEDFAEPFRVLSVPEPGGSSFAGFDPAGPAGAA